MEGDKLLKALEFNLKGCNYSKFLERGHAPCLPVLACFARYESVYPE